MTTSEKPRSPHKPGSSAWFVHMLHNAASMLGVAEDNPRLVHIRGYGYPVSGCGCAVAAIDTAYQDEGINLDRYDTVRKVYKNSGDTEEVDNLITRNDTQPVKKTMAGFNVPGYEGRAYTQYRQCLTREGSDTIKAELIGISAGIQSTGVVPTWLSDNFAALQKEGRVPSFEEPIPDTEPALHALVEFSEPPTKEPRREVVRGTKRWFAKMLRNAANMLGTEEDGARLVHVRSYGYPEQGCGCALAALDTAYKDDGLRVSRYGAAGLDGIETPSGQLLFDLNDTLPCKGAFKIEGTGNPYESRAKLTKESSDIVRKELRRLAAKIDHGGEVPRDMLVRFTERTVKACNE